MQRVAVTGLALASPFGQDEGAFWEGLCVGPTPARTWCDPDFPELSCRAVLLDEALRPPPVPGQAPVVALARRLIERALGAAGLPRAPAGCGLALGSHFAETDHLRREAGPWPAPMLATLAREGGFEGPVCNTPIGCAAGNLALCWAADRLRQGHAEVMVAGGVDLFGAASMGTFQMFDNISQTLPRPFSADRDGFLMGEGGALLVLEQEAHAAARGAEVRGWLVGTGTGHDGAHPTRPSLDGQGLRGALQGALQEAGLRPAQIDAVSAHSPGTVANDPAEAAAYRGAFGPRGVPVTAAKAALGHAMGGANALEAAGCLLMLRHQRIPPTLNVAAPDPAFALDLVLDEPRAAPLRRVLSAACGMGGANAVVILEAAS